MPPLITLTTDFGLRNPFVGIMKGVLLSICPSARLVDLTHEIEPRDVRGGALALEAALPFFPAGTVHLAVVDPGVGSARRAIAVRAGGCYLVGPDNGLFTLALE
ncbi:MAG: SAM-dependent chlorinase/fluorinase, partial [Candidatus Rokuibacteriota bacterium]